MDNLKLQKILHKKTSSTKLLRRFFYESTWFYLYK